MGNVKKILAIRNDKIGDLVLSSNAIEILRRKFPEARIDMIVSNENKALIEENKAIHKIYVLNYSPRTFRQFLDYFRVSAKIRKEKYDLGVEIRGSLINILLLLFFGRVRKKIGFYTHWLAKLFLDYAYFKDYKGHATENMVKMMNGALHMDYSYVWPKIETSHSDKKEVKDFFSRNKISKCISLCVDASNEEKQWSLEKFDELIKYLHRKHPSYKIVLVGIDKEKINYLMGRNSFCVEAFKKDLRSLFLMFGRSELVIGADGGTMHLAWVSRAKTIVLIPSYLSNFVEDIRPLGENANYILGDFKKISVDEVASICDKCLR